MTVVSTHRPPQTLKQAKAEYSKHGPRMSSQQSRQLARGAVLYERAQKIKDAEKRRKLAQKKRQDREDREREARRRMGIASQKPYASPHQMLMGNFVIQKPAEQPAPDEPWEDDDDSLDEELLQAASSKPEPVHEVAAPCVTTPYLDGSGAQEALEGWGDLLLSNTQVEREISQEEQKNPPGDLVYTRETFDIPLSTQDVSFSLDDLEELGVTMPRTAHIPNDVPDKKQDFITARQLLPSRSTNTIDQILMPPPPSLRHRPSPLARSSCKQDMTLLDELSTLDFELSTQDCREIIG